MVEASSVSKPKRRPTNRGSGGTSDYAPYWGAFALGASFLEAAFAARTMGSIVPLGNDQQNMTCLKCPGKCLQSIESVISHLQSETHERAERSRPGGPLAHSNDPLFALAAAAGRCGVPVPVPVPPPGRATRCRQGARRPAQRLVQEENWLQSTFC